MADTQSDLVTNGSVGYSNTPKGMVLAAVASYTIPASGAPGIGDLVEMISMPEGAIILDVVVAADGGTASMTIDVGDATTVDRFIDGLDASAALITSLSSAGDVANAGVGFEYTSEDTIDITFNTAAPTAADVYTMTVTYVMA